MSGRDGALSEDEAQRLLERAWELAERAHAGQRDKGGAPYVGHPRRVAASLTDPAAKIVGALHDAVEDSDLTLETLSGGGFPPRIVRAIDAVTKREGEDYEDYLARVMADPIALAVKIADMRDNMDLGRIPEPTPKDRRRLEKYRRVLPRLEEALRHFGP